MRYPGAEKLAMLRRKYPQGLRVRLLEMDDVQAPPSGTEGTVLGVDDIGNLLVNWDNGCGLNVILGVDRIEII